MELIDRSDIRTTIFTIRHSTYFRPSNGRAHPVCSEERKEQILGKDVSFEYVAGRRGCALLHVCQECGEKGEEKNKSGAIRSVKGYLQGRFLYPLQREEGRRGGDEDRIERFHHADRHVPLSIPVPLPLPVAILLPIPRLPLPYPRFSV